MPLPSPDLDDRTFESLVRTARELVAERARDTGWTDLSAGDPGIVLLEAFAYLADTTIYRLNRVPDKLYVEFLRLIGVRLEPPAAATVELRFERDTPGDAAIEIPRGTRVTTASAVPGSEAPVFATVESVTLLPNAGSVTVQAVHAELIAGEELGRGSGAAGLSFRVRRPPIIAPSGNPLDLVVGVEALDGEIDDAHPGIEFEGTSYRIWREVPDFADRAATDEVFLADRTDGLIILAPATRMRVPEIPGTGRNGPPRLADHARALAAVPREGRVIRAWYRRGGGPGGNVGAGLLSVLRDPVPGVRVTNPAAAAGGRAGETLENARLRGPQELRSSRRAVTARDYQLLAVRASGGVARARAFTQAALWAHATPGTVDLVLVPAVPDGTQPGTLTGPTLEGLESEPVRRAVQEAIDAARPLGTRCEVAWADYKTVHVQATIVVQREEDIAAVRARVEERLRLSLSPLPTRHSAEGWPFGQSLYASNVYQIILSEPGVRYAKGIRLSVDEVPDREVAALDADRHQPRTWHAGAADGLFRSLNDGDGWERMRRFPGGAVTVTRSDALVPGLLAIVVEDLGGDGSSVHVSRDAGATWPFVHRFGFTVSDLAWTHDQGRPELLLAGVPSRTGGGQQGGGLYRMGIAAGDDPVLVNVDPADQARPYSAVATVTGIRGETTVAVAADGLGGVWVSTAAGAAGTFRPAGLKGEDVRVLAIEVDGPRAYLWAGTAAPGGDQPGKGCFRQELLGVDLTADGWQPFATGWTAGTCLALGFDDGAVLAATWQAGVLRLDPRRPAPAWEASTVDSGLPMRDLRRFQPVTALAVRPGGGLAMAGGPSGVLRSRPRASGAPEVGAPAGGPSASWEVCSGASFSEQVTLPPTGLFVAGDNDLKVVADAAG